MNLFEENKISKKEVERIIQQIYNSPSYLAFLKARKKALSKKEWSDFEYIDEILECLRLPKYTSILNFFEEYIGIIVKKMKQDEIDIDNLCQYLNQKVNKQLLDIRYLELKPEAILKSAFQYFFEENEK